jgi:hypothetical protein
MAQFTSFVTGKFSAGFPPSSKLGIDDTMGVEITGVILDFEDMLKY